MDVNPLDPYRAANLLIAQYGSDASAHAMQRALDMRAAADGPGETVWLRVFDAVLELQRTRPHEGEATH